MVLIVGWTLVRQVVPGVRQASWSACVTGKITPVVQAIFDTRKLAGEARLAGFE